MKLIIIGDIHGKLFWKDIVNKHSDASKFIILGDYFDSYTISGEQQIENFKDIIAFKDSLKNDCTLLIGNHDVHYLNWWEEKYSGFQNGYQYTISHLLHTHLDKLQMCHVEDNYCFTHAGITKTWAERHDINLSNLEQSINDRWRYKPLSFMFQGKDIYGDDVTQSPIWVRPNSLKKDAIEGYIHVVGHTATKDIVYDDNIILVDCLEKKKYLILEI